MSGKPQIGIQEDAAYVQFGDLLKELPRQVAGVLIDPNDPLAEVVRPVTVKAWRTALIEAAGRGELKGSPLVAGVLRGGMGEGVTVSSIKSFLELRGFEVVATRPDVPGEMQSRIVQIHRDDLSAAIDVAKARAADPTDTASVWSELLRLAGDKHPPLMEVVDGAVKYQASTGNIELFAKENLRLRLRGAKAKRL